MEYTEDIVTDIVTKKMSEMPGLSYLLGCYEYETEEEFRKDYFKLKGALEYKDSFNLYFITKKDLIQRLENKTDEYYKIKNNILLNIRYSFELYGMEIEDNVVEGFFEIIVSTLKKDVIVPEKIKIDVESNSLYRYIIDKYRGEYSSKMINDLLDFFSFVNNKTNYINNFFIDNGKMFVTEEINVDESLIQDEHKLLISNFEHDSYNRVCIVDNYTPCGLITYSIDYFIKKGYTVITRFGSSLPIHIDDNGRTIEKNYNVDADGKPISDKVIYISNNLYESKHLGKLNIPKTRLKTLIFLNCDDFRYNELKKEFNFKRYEFDRFTYTILHTFKKLMLNTNKHIFNNFFVNLMVHLTKFTEYNDEVKQLCNDYVDERIFNSPYGKLRNEVINNYDNIINNMSKEYDDSKTGLIKKFMEPYKSYISSGLDYTPFALCLYGAAGTGKSYFSNKIADVLFGGEKSTFSISLNSISSIEMLSSELFGSAKGYVGSNKKTELQKFIETNIDEGGVILVDEVDKVKTDEAIDMFLTILSTGKVSFNGEHATEHSISKFVFVFCGNYEVSGSPNEYSISKMSKPFKSRMQVIEQVLPSNNKEKMISSIFYKEVCDKIRRYGITTDININVDKSVSKLSFFSGNEINGREYRRTILAKFGLVISNIIDNIIKNKNTNFTISVNQENKNILINAK